MSSDKRRARQRTKDSRPASPKAIIRGYTSKYGSRTGSLGGCSVNGAPLSVDQLPNNYWYRLRDLIEWARLYYEAPPSPLMTETCWILSKRVDRQLPLIMSFRLNDMFPIACVDAMTVGIDAMERHIAEHRIINKNVHYVLPSSLTRWFYGGALTHDTW